jgi:hypothetical protein
VALRFSKRLKIAPGVKINIGLKGISTTVGPKGASINLGKKGAYLNAGIPGTGLSTRTKIGAGKKSTETPSSQTSATNGLLLGSLAAVLVIGLLVWIL